MALTLKAKVELYENFLKKIADHDVVKEMTEALEDPHNPGRAPVNEFNNPYPFAFGLISLSFKDAVSDAQYALDQGKK